MLQKIEQAHREDKAAIGALVLMVETPSKALMDKAEPILRAAGGTNIRVLLG